MLANGREIYRIIRGLVIIIPDLAIGIDGIIGLEYTFDEVPFSISLDWKPTFNIAEHAAFLADEAGLSIRYVIK